MLRVLTSLVFGCSFVSFAQTPAFLSSEESASVLRAIDDICGDTWCAGDLNYRFDRLSCAPSGCFLDVKVETRNQDSQGMIRRESRDYRCVLNGFQTRSDLIQETPFGLSYSQKLFSAVGQCLNTEVAAAYPLIYVPDVSSCRAAIEQKPSFPSAAHSVYAEVFYELEDRIRAGAQALQDMVVAYGQTYPSCQLSLFALFRDQVACATIGSQDVCSFPSSEGQFVVIKDFVDGAAVLYMKDRKQPQTSLGRAFAGGAELQLPDSSGCYTELLNLNAQQPAAQPFASVDHRSYFVSTKGLRLTRNVGSNATQLVRTVLKNLQRTQPKTCLYQDHSKVVGEVSCGQVGGRDLCFLAPSQAGGYFVVSKDNAAGAFVTFVRYD